MKLAIFIALIVCAVGVDSQCWWSGCQPNTWAERGCFPSTDWHQTSSQPCSNGSIVAQEDLQLHQLRLKVKT